MADTNLIRLTDTTHTHISTITTGDAQDGTDASGYDEDGATYQGFLTHTLGNFQYIYATVEAEHVFSRPCTLRNIKYQFFVYGDWHRENGYAIDAGGYAYVEYQLEGSSSWVAVYSSPDPGTTSPVTINVSTLTTWTGTVENVRKVRCRLCGWGFGSGGGAWGIAAARLYELQAWGDTWTEVLRIKKGSQVIKIGGRPVAATDKLRLYKGTTVMGIPLVDTNSAFASPIRIYDGSAVKSLPLAP